jgi:hypothetical protein
MSAQLFVQVDRNDINCEFYGVVTNPYSSYPAPRDTEHRRARIY